MDMKQNPTNTCTHAEQVGKTISIYQEPHVSVGIVSGKRICFALNKPYEVNGSQVLGDQTAELAEGGIVWQGATHRDLVFRPTTPEASFSLKDVTIGVNFHWERKEMQTFMGTLRLVIDDDKIWAINELPVEQYLESVISSEMSATSSLQLLKAHAVISRSWLLAQMVKRQAAANEQAGKPSFVEDNDTVIRWYDREDHTLFDVCADDHCQRYQGITKKTSCHVAEAIQQTRGEILAADGAICDARFSKCCGGAVEEFQYCWEDTPKSYLRALRDWLPPRLAALASTGKDTPALPDLTQEEQAERWIRTRPASFCNTADKTILSQVLNDYDQETTNFYRWQVTYTQDELTALLRKKLHIDFGTILDMIPVERGKSGRLVTLKIVGTTRTLTIGKELEIRRALSHTHLYSSAFVVDKEDIDGQGAPARFVLTGAGWGHGVGLCQIGAAVMGEQGFAYDEILAHYYPGAAITKSYQ